MAPCTEQLVTVGTQPGAIQMCLLGSQAVPVGQAPQFWELSQPSPTTPQYWPPWNVHETLVQLGLPQTPVTLAPHALPPEQVAPQVVDPPQPSPITPQ